MIECGQGQAKSPAHKQTNVIFLVDIMNMRLKQRHNDSQQKTSRFYISYPSRDTPQSQSKAKRGVIDTLQMFKGFGFNPNDSICAHAILSAYVSNGSIFTLSEAGNENIKRINF